MNLERRTASLELRADGKTKLTGYAAVFDQETVFNGQREVIRAGAFAESLRSGGDVLALADHDPSKVLGRTKSGTLQLREDSHGLAFELRTPNTTRGRDLMEMATRGDLGGMSFGFHVTGDEYVQDVREIRAADLFEISIVSSFPAYAGTSVEARTKLSTLPALADAQRRIRILTGEIDMGFFDRLSRRAAPSQTIKSADPYLAEFFGLRTGSFQADVNRETAGGLPVAYACVQLISQTLASMPLHLFAKTADGGREKQTSHPLARVLSDMSSESVTSFEAREYLVASVLIDGNGYAKITWNGKGQVEALEPLAPQHVTVKKLTNGRLRYTCRAKNGSPVILNQDDVLHLRHRLDSDGVYGLSPITVARAAFNQSIAQHEAAYTQAKSGFRPSGVVGMSAPIGDDAKAEVIEGLAAKAADTSDKGGILVLDSGATWTPLAFNSKDSKFLESRKLSDLAIARIFAVPPTAIGIPHNATYSNVLGENQALVARCLAPMAPPDRNGHEHGPPAPLSAPSDVPRA